MKGKVQSGWIYLFWCWCFIGAIDHIVGSFLMGTLFWLATRYFQEKKMWGEADSDILVGFGVMYGATASMVTFMVAIVLVQTIWLFGWKRIMKNAKFTPFIPVFFISYLLTWRFTYLLEALL